MFFGPPFSLPSYGRVVLERTFRGIPEPTDTFQFPSSCWTLLQLLVHPHRCLFCCSRKSSYRIASDFLKPEGLIDALRSGEGIDALLARHEEVMREFRLDAVYDHKDD